MTAAVPAGIPVAVVDLGVGNLGNVERALAAAGGAAARTSDPAAIRAAGRIVLPGVGAFRPPRERLRGELEAALRGAVANGAWLFGICVGYQLLFEGSDEFGATDGLGYFAGRVTELPEDLPRPHIGWNRLRFAGNPSLLDGIDDGAFAYFVHSFAPEGAERAEIATTLHGRRFAAVSAAGRIAGAQFHPEKSGETGVRLLSNFLRVAPEAAAWS
jgi:imidazole glycerol-phosphate synthase subunit HisH